MRAFQDMLLQPLKALLMRALQQQLSKYIHNIELEELGLLGGDVVLENLEIRKDVLHDSLRIPTDYDFSRGFIKELRIHIPWTRLQSRPIEIKFKTVEIIICPTTHTRAVNDPSPNWLQRPPHARQSRPGEEHASSSGAATGWMQQLLTKVLANMSVSVSNLVLKYEDADVVLSAALKSLTCFSADPDRDWTPAFASLDDPFGLLHKLVRASHLTVCLDRYCAPDSTRRRQVQAFEVPILNRASFDVRLLVCVWLVAPGPGEPAGGGSEDEKAQADWRDFADEDAVEVSGKSWSVGTGVKMKTPARGAVGLLGRLVGVELRVTPRKGEAANATHGSPTSGSESAPGTQLASAAAEAAATAEREINWLPVPCVCPMLRDGWSRRASSSYSPFYDGDGVWSRSEGDRGDDATRIGAGVPGEQAATDSSARTGEQEEAGGTARLMPSPTVVADVLIEDLSFSLSNLQVLMMKELIDRAVDHVASNASRNNHPPPSAPREMPPSPDPWAAPVSGRWWPSLWRGSAWTAEDPKTNDAGQTDTDQRDDDEDEEDVGDAIFFVVVSASVGSISLSLLEHQPQAGGKGEVEEETEAAVVEEPVSISVPVHGLGTVSVSSVPVALRPLLRPPVAFVVAEVTGVVVDAHVLPDGKELSADVKVQVSSVVVRHAPRQDEARMPSEVRRKRELEAEPFLSWGVAIRGPAASTSHGEEEQSDRGGLEIPPPDFLPDPRSAVLVRRCLLERLRGSPVVSTEVASDTASSSGAGMESPRRSPGKLLRQAQVQVVQSPASPRPRWVPAPYPRTRGGGRCALQYRLLKQRDVEIEGLGGDGFSSTSACHDLSLGLVRTHLTVALLEQLLNFAGLGKRGEHPVKPHATDRPSSLQESKVAGAVGHASTRPAMTPPARSASVPSQGEPWRARRASWSPVRGAGNRSAHMSPRATPAPPPSIATSETSLHLVLFPVDLALDLSAGGEDCGEHSSTENSAASLVLSVGQVEMTGSESASSYSGAADERHEWKASAPSRSSWEDDSRQRVCTLSLSMLSLTFLDGSTIVATAQEPTAIGNLPYPLAARVFAASVRTDLPTTHRLVRLRGCRVTAEVISSVPRAAHPQAASGMTMVRDGSPKKKKHDLGFNASCESIRICASAGVAPLALEMHALTRKIILGGAAIKSERRCCNSRAERETGASRVRWTHAWRRGVLSSLADVSFGGVMKGQDYQLTGNIGRLTVGRVDDERRDGQGVGDSSHVAVFQGHEHGTEALSWSLETSSDGGVTSTSVTSDFKSAALHYVNIKRVVRQVELALGEWKVGVARARLISGRNLVTEAHASTGKQKRSTRPVHFDVRGLAVSLQLPFELRLEAEGIRANTRRVPRVATRGRSAGHRWNTTNDGEMTMDLLAGDVKVFHAMHGAQASPEDAQPPAIRCAARGIVSLRPAVNAISVALESEHVHARLTPAFCSSFGSFVRFMVGPPPATPTVASSSTVASRGIGVDGRIGHTPLSSSFDLRVRQVVADFVPCPCSPWAVAANLIVGGLVMRQKATAAAPISPAGGSKAFFEMSFENVAGTQRRDPRRNAPAIPREAVALIGEYLKQRNPGGDNCAAYVFVNWLAARREVTRTVADEDSDGNRQPFVIPLKVEVGENAAATGAQAFSLNTTVSGPRQRLVNSLTLRIAPMLLACYPPVVRLLVGHYNRFGGQAFRSFSSRSNLPRKKVGVMTYDVDIQGCSAVLLSSLAVGARGLHVSAGQVTVKENGPTSTAASSSSPFTTQYASSSRADGSTAPMEPVVSMAGFVGPVGVTFVRDWRRLLPKHSHATSSSSSGALGALGSNAAGDHAQLCVPIDLRWTVHYDRTDHFRQDISLSSVQLYLEQSHFDLYMRLVQILVASDFPGALPPKSRSSSTDPSAWHRKGGMVAGIAVDDATAVPLTSPAGGTGSDVIDSFLNLSLRLPLLQVVLAMGTRDGPDPPVLEIDVASVRLARGGVLTVRHVSVNSWPQQHERRGPMESATAPATGSSERGYRVLERSGQSEESGKDFARVEVRVPTTTLGAGRLVPPQPQLDVVFQVEPFNIHVNPGIIHSLAAFATPVPFEPGSPEALEEPFPYSVPAATAAAIKMSRRDQSTSLPSSSTAVNDPSSLERPRSSSSAGMKQSMDFEKAAKTAAISMKLIASHVSITLSSYPGGPAFIATSSHIFVRAITWRSRAGGNWATRGLTGDGIGTEIFTRFSRVSCSVDTSNGWPLSSRPKHTTWAGGPRRTDLQGGDTVLKPFDVDVHLTRPQAKASDGGGDKSARCSLQEQGWQAAIYVDELYFRLSAAHTRSLERLAALFIPAVTTAQLTAGELARGPGHRAAITSVRGDGLTRADDLRVLQRVESSDFVEETAVRPRPGQAVFYGVGAVAPTASEETIGANPEEPGEDDWVTCCIWHYWGLRRVVQVALPHEPLSGSVSLLEGLVLDSLEVELSFVDPLTGKFKAATRFTVPCKTSSTLPDGFFTMRRARPTVEPSQPFHARTWRLSWRVPTWIRPPGGASPPIRSAFAVSLWSCTLLRSLSVQSTPAGPALGPSCISTTLSAQRITLALLTDDHPSVNSPNKEGSFPQAEEILRVVVDELNLFAEAGPSGGDELALVSAAVATAAARGSAVMAIEVQDFSNFLRLPLLSHALVTWDVARSSCNKRNRNGGIVSALSPFRPVMSAAVEVRDAVVSISATATQCINRCLGDLSHNRFSDGTSGVSDVARDVPSRPSTSLPSGSSPPRLQLQRQERKGYVVTNRTDRSLWFGQVSTTETVILGPGVSTAYRWRTIPSPVAAATGGAKGVAPSRLILLLRLALHRERSSAARSRDTGGDGDHARGGAGFGAWTEPFPADHAGTYMRLLRSAGGEGRPLAAEQADDTKNREDAMAVPVWITVSKQGLQTRIELSGEWIFTNHLPQQVQVAWATSTGLGNSVRSLGERPGIRGSLKVDACGPDEGVGDVDPGNEARVRRPDSYSVLTACAPVAITGTTEEWRGRLSELMLEFRLATPGSAAVVGSVGPPPVAAMNVLLSSTVSLPVGRAAHGGRKRGSERGGAGEPSCDHLNGGDEEVDRMSWAATRQSDWVEATPGVHLSLISCASPDPASSGLWFWCVASRKATPLSDCTACLSSVSGHRCLLGQMMIDLRPIAMVWNRCSLPLRVVLESAGRGRGDSESAFAADQHEYKVGPAEMDDRPLEDPGVPSRDVEADASSRCSETRAAGGFSVFHLEGSSSALQPGGRTAVCQQPFVDYRLTVAAAATGVTEAVPPREFPSDSQSARQFVVSVPSELLSRSCESRWLPLHERALNENVLCPLVVVASRSLDTHWPSLSLRVYPGLSIRNHLTVPLSLLSVFSQPLHDATSAAAQEKGCKDPSRYPHGYGRRNETETADTDGEVPEVSSLRRGGAGGEGSLSAAGGDGVENVQDQSPPVVRVSRVFRIPAESLHSAWDIHDSDGNPVPFLLPTVSVEIGLCSEGDMAATTPAASSSTQSSGLNLPSDPRDFRTHGDHGQPARGNSRSTRLTVKLDSEFSELVLIPWGPRAPVMESDRSRERSLLQQSAVLPVFVTLVREAVSGGVDLVRLEIHPRAVLHNATSLPVSLSLLGAHSDDSPLCRIHLAPDGPGSSMTVLALPGRRGHYPAVSTDSINSSASSRGDFVDARSAAIDVGADATGAPKCTTSGTLQHGLSWLMKSATYKAAPVRPTGFWADLELAYGWEDQDGDTPAVRDEAADGVDGGDDGKVRVGTGIAAKRKSVISLLQPSGGAPLRCEPASITMTAESGRRGARICVTTETQTRNKSRSSIPASPTRHILLHQDPQPDLTIYNRAAGPVTILLDCGTLLEVGPGETVEHSWPVPGDRDRGASAGATVNPGASSGVSKRPPRPTPASPRGQRYGRDLAEARSRNDSESSLISIATQSSAPESPVAVSLNGTPQKRGSARVARSSTAGNHVSSKGRPPGKLFGGADAATLQHWFKCKGSGQGDQFSSWSNPLWVARGVQVIRFDRQGAGSAVGGGDNDTDDGGSDRCGSNDWGFSGVGGGDGTFGAGPEAREVQVHVVERAGGFVMSFAEGGFENVSAGGGAAGGKNDATAENNSSVLRRWAETQEQHLVLTVSKTTLQLLDDSDITAVAATAMHQDFIGGSLGISRGLAAKSVPNSGTRVMDGWIGGNWEGPRGLLLDAASASLPAAAIPAILSVFVGGSCMRIWRAAPAVRQDMSTLDVETAWHLKDRVGVDFCLEMLQVDNHVAGHNLPVIFCFRQGGSLVHGSETGSGGSEMGNDCRFTLSLLLAEPWNGSRMPAYLENVSVRSSPMDFCFEDSVLPPLVKFLERAGFEGGVMDGSYSFGAAEKDSSSSTASAAGGSTGSGAQLPACLAASMVPRLFIQRVDIGALVVRATVQGYIPGKQVFLSLDKSPLLFRPVSLRGVLARPDEIAEQIASNYAVDALLRSLAVVGSLQALGSPTTLLTEWGKGVYDLFAMPIKAVPQGPSSTIRATFSGISSLVRHASAGTLSSVSGVTNALSRNLGSRGGVARPIAGTMGLVHRTSRSLIASTGVDSEWTHAEAAAAANPAVCRLNADLWYRWCLLPPGHEFLYRTPALCSNASYSQANVPVTIVLSSKAVFLYRGGSGCETLWKQIEHQHITLVEQSAEHAPAELILNARAFRRPRSFLAGPVARYTSDETAVGTSASASGRGSGRRAGGVDAARFEQDDGEVGGLLMKLSLPNSACCRELAQLLQSLSENA